MVFSANQRIRQLRVRIGATCIAVGLVGFALLSFIDVIPSLREWAIHHVLTSGSFISFAVAGFFILLFARPKDPEELVKWASAEGYNATSKEKELVGAWLVTWGKTMLVLMPASAVFYVLFIYFFIEPGFMSAELDVGSTGLLFAFAAALTFAIFFLLLFLVFVVVVMHLNGRIRDNPELKEFYKSAMDGLLVSHAELLRKLTMREVVRRGSDGVSEDYVNGEAKKFMKGWRRTLILWAPLCSFFVWVTLSLQTQWGAEMTGVSTLLTFLLLIPYGVSFATSMWFPRYLVRKYNYYQPTRKGDILPGKEYGDVYTRLPLSVVLIDGILLDLVAGCLGILILLVGVVQVDGELFTSTGLTLILFSFFGIALQRQQAGRIIKQVLRETERKKR